MLANDTIVDYSPAPVVTRNRRRILIIDDNAEQAEAMAYGMEQQDFESFVASTLAAGRISIDLHKPHLIIMDICLPDGNGLKLCTEVSDDAETSSVPIIVLSAVDGPDIVRQARSAGCQFFVRKPYDPNAILTLVNEALKHSDW